MSQPNRTLSAEDLRAAEEHGIAAEDAIEQYRILTSPRPKLEVVAPCGLGEGIATLAAETHRELLDAWRSAAQAGQVVKFVPASGHATRMFQSIASALPEPPEELEIAMLGNTGAEADTRDLVANLSRLALWPQALQALEDRGLEAQRWLGEGRIDRLLRELIFSPDGLAYQPKALIGFHRAADGSQRSAAEEHLAEGAQLTRDAEGRCRVHFTTSPDQQSKLLHHLEKSPLMGIANFEIESSTQSASTDTLAITPEATPFRDADGRILFRPGGHGALLHNLSRLDAEFVLIKNVDNVQPEEQRGPSILWQRLMVGRAARLQAIAREHYGGLAQAPDPARIAAARRFLEDAFGIEITNDLEGILERLRRPIRVCGMVPNTGEPGGGPFWTKGRAGRSPQIVEAAELAPESQPLLAAATHFNPTFLALALGGADPAGPRPDLQSLVDTDRYFVADKSWQGRPLRALERPGLWNGAMAGWNTVFVEVPLAVFTPVKTINDLLRSEHQGVDR